MKTKEFMNLTKDKEDYSLFLYDNFDNYSLNAYKFGIYILFYKNSNNEKVKVFDIKKLYNNEFEYEMKYAETFAKTLDETFQDIYIEIDNENKIIWIKKEVY